MANILLVEDEDQLRSLLKEVLESAGHAVYEARDGKSALNIFEFYLTDLVVTDLIMPEKEGLELIRELRRSQPDIKIIAMSGGGRNNAHDYLEMAKKFGAAILLEKPFSNDNITEAVSALLETPAL